MCIELQQFFHSLKKLKLVEPILGGGSHGEDNKWPETHCYFVLCTTEPALSMCYIFNIISEGNVYILLQFLLWYIMLREHELGELVKMKVGAW